jgi:5,10-methenyltetrahydrofolate synthetase
MHTAPQPADLEQWRRNLRSELIARREAVPAATRREWDLAISLKLLHALPVRPEQVLGFCWPYRAEYDARHLLRRLRDQGLRCALPVVRGRDAPLIFRYWAPGVPMQKGALGIPYPEMTAQLEPQLVLVPLVGFGGGGERLGYGGGYFDRTLASYARRPLCVGVGYEFARLDSIFPQAYDIPMDAIVTEVALRKVEDGQLVEVSASQLRAQLVALEQARAEQARHQAHRVADPR